MPPDDDRDRPRVAPRLDRARDAVPDDPRPQLGELVGRVVAGEHPERRLEDVAPELGEVLRSAGERVEVVDGPRAVHRGRDQLLGEHVERVARDDRRLDRALVHEAGHDRGLEQVAAILREEDAARRLADLVAGPADALEATGDRAGRLDLDDEVDRSHVDAELERRGRDDRGQVGPA